MISFACRSINLKDIISCSFSLNKTEYKLLMFLLEQDGPLSIQDIGTRMNLERSTVQKAIKGLLSRELAVRRQLNLQEGGYRYIYASADKRALKSRITEIVEGWHTNVLEAVDAW